MMDNLPVMSIYFTLIILEKFIKNPIPTTDDMRRKLIKAGIYTPVAITLYPKSVLAGNCNTLSGMLSGNLSGTEGGTQICNNFSMKGGHSLEFWKSICTKGTPWPIDPATKFFSANAFTASPQELKNMSLLAVLFTTYQNYCNVSEEEFNFCQIAVIAYLNSLSIEGYFVTPSQVQHIVFDILIMGNYGDLTDGINQYDITQLFLESWDSFSAPSALTNLNFPGDPEVCSDAIDASTMTCNQII